MQILLINWQIEKTPTGCNWTSCWWWMRRRLQAIRCVCAAALELLPLPPSSQQHPEQNQQDPSGRHLDLMGCLPHLPPETPSLARQRMAELSGKEINASLMQGVKGWRRKPPVWMLYDSRWGTNFPFVLIEKQWGGSEAPTLVAAEARLSLCTEKGSGIWNTEIGEESHYCSGWPLH